MWRVCLGPYRAGPARGSHFMLGAYPPAPPAQIHSLPPATNLLPDLISHSLTALPSIQYQQLGLWQGSLPLTVPLDVRLHFLSTVWLCLSRLIALGPCSCETMYWTACAHSIWSSLDSWICLILGNCVIHLLAFGDSPTSILWTGQSGNWERILHFFFFAPRPACVCLLTLSKCPVAPMRKPVSSCSDTPVLPFFLFAQLLFNIRCVYAWDTYLTRYL